MAMTEGKVYLGIWGYSADAPRVQTHDSGAAVIVDGEIVSAVNEERLTRKKSDGSYPFQSIEKVLELAGIQARDVDVVAQAGLAPIPRSLKMLKYIWKTYTETGILMPNRILYALLTAKKIRQTLPDSLRSAKHVFVEHHQAHAACAYYTSPWPESTVITLDGIGDSAICGTINSGVDGLLTRHRELNGYYSPGILYSFVTKYFGFKPSRHEGKITGLAAYGDPQACIDAMRAISTYDPVKHDFYSEFIPHLFKAQSYESWNDVPLFEELSDEFTREDIAAGVQQISEETITAVVADAVQMTGLKRVSLSGGVLSNVKVNQRIRELEVVEDVYVHPNMSDGGLAAGAALKVWAGDVTKGGGSPVPRYLKDVYLGPSFTNADVEKAIGQFSFRAEKSHNVEEKIAQLLQDKTIVGHFCGKMEYGPRALGNRSILADATDNSINQWLNDRLTRTEFMPFAPSILEEHSAEYYKGWDRDQAAARFMTMTYDVNDGLAESAPAVAHIDNTARPQVVRQEDNPRYHKVLSLYREKTGLPLVVNTSFNVHEEPIVCSPEDALRSLEKNSVDVLVMEDWIVSKD